MNNRFNFKKSDIILPILFLIWIIYYSISQGVIISAIFSFDFISFFTIGLILSYLASLPLRYTDLQSPYHRSFLIGAILGPLIFYMTLYINAIMPLPVISNILLLPFTIGRTIIPHQHDILDSIFRVGYISMSLGYAILGIIIALIQERIKKNSK
ncbi:MAG: hypothetical protein ACI83O_000096 [Patescibacteria group bacterium]|jgi:hypothetical protein